MSKSYYRSLDKHTGWAYKVGRQFEYRAMHELFQLSWHAMRRFGSHGVKFCGKCGRHVHYNRDKCVHCGTGKNVMKASLDFTAYKNGVYIMATCKFSQNKSTMYLDDPIWYNLVTYANVYGALPVFCGINEKRAVYYTNLLTLKPLSAKFLDDPAKFLPTEFVGISTSTTYRQKVLKKADPNMVDRMINECWDVIEMCNEQLGDEKATAAAKARWGTIKVIMLNVINRALYSTGLNASKDDMTDILENADKVLADLDKEEQNLVGEREKHAKKEKDERVKQAERIAASAAVTGEK